MKTIDQIIITNDPLLPEREDDFDSISELTFDDVKEYGETFFAVGFTATVWLTDNSQFSFIKVDHDHWEWTEIDDEGIGEITQLEGGFLDALNALLDFVNFKPSES